MGKYCELQEGRLVVHVPKELDHHEASGLKMEADLMIDAYHIKSLVFDFSKTEFMDSSGIGVIIGRCRSMGYYGGKVSAQNLNERLKKIFKTSGLHTLIQVDGLEKNGKGSDM